MTRPRLAFTLLLLACAPPSDEPPDDDEGADTEGSSTLEPPETTGESSETTAVESSESTEPTSSTSTSSTSTSESGASSETTEGGPECGDGLVTGEEVCDDGVNDGSYGGCAIGCGALASHCGDGAWDEPQEMCDEGEGNANGTGCNVDCVISGTLLFEYEIGTGTDWCFNGTEPAVRADGSVVFAYRHACADATRLVELSPELEEVAWQDVLLTSFGDQATGRGTDWILGAWECDTIVTEDGEITEVCNDDRISGSTAIEAVDDERYITVLTENVAQWGVASPSEGDAPEWTASGPIEDEDEEYSLAGVTPEASGSVAAAGSYTIFDGVGYQSGYYVWRFDSAGNHVASALRSEMWVADDIKDSPDGALVLRGAHGDGTDLVRLDSNLDLSWAIDACSYYLSSVDVDSAGQILIHCESADGSVLRKLDAFGSVLWSADTQTQSKGIVIDSSDHVVLSTWYVDESVPEIRLRIEKYAP